MLLKWTKVCWCTCTSVRKGIRKERKVLHLKRRTKPIDVKRMQVSHAFEYCVVYDAIFEPNNKCAAIFRIKFVLYCVYKLLLSEPSECALYKRAHATLQTPPLWLPLAMISKFYMCDCACMHASMCEKDCANVCFKWRKRCFKWVKNIC